MNKYLRWHDQITRSRGPKRNVTLSATRLSLDSSSLIDTSSLKDHLYVPQPTPKPTRWQPKGSSIFERNGLGTLSCRLRLRRLHPYCQIMTKARFATHSKWRVKEAAGPPADWRYPALQVARRDKLARATWRARSNQTVGSAQVATKETLMP